MATKKKLLQAAAGSAGGAGLDVDEVFSTYLYTGNESNLTITNGIDLSGEGGMVWAKKRNSSGYDPVIQDTERGAGKNLKTNSTGSEQTFTDAISSFNSDGFSFTGGGGSLWNQNTAEMASWTFRKAPKFFDVLTYTGTGVNGRTVSHNLGTTPGMIIVKQTSASGEPWYVYHRSLGGTKRIYLNSTGSAGTTDDGWFNTQPTSTEFTVAYNGTNKSGATYVAYLFAHNDGDGEFGPSGDQDIIKCGSYSGNGSADGNFVDLGFEPQWVMVKRSDAGAENWAIFDNMRLMAHSYGLSNNGKMLNPNASSSESGAGFADILPTGFKLSRNEGVTNQSGGTYIYMAIRRGPMAVPESATDVFAVEEASITSRPQFFTSGFPVDVTFARKVNGASDQPGLASRLTNGKEQRTSTTTAEGSTSWMAYDFMNGVDSNYWNTGFGTVQLTYMWKRAPHFCDVVCHTGNGTNHHAIAHNLGVAPEMIWTKCRSSSKDWGAYVLGEEMYLNTTNSSGTDRGYSQTYDPTDTHFYLGTVDTTNESGLHYISYLFASLDGVSKVGSYTGDGNSGRVIDCGFSNGARLVLAKSYTHADNWWLFDSERGIVAGNDPRLWLNTSDAEVTNADTIDAHSSGFIVNNTNGELNDTGRSYIFYAIA
jgi:hypothetical protein